MREEAIPAEAFWTIDTLREAFVRDESPEHLRYMATVIGLRLAEQSEGDKVQALFAARWIPNFEGYPYQWKWRRPGKRPGKQGRLFESTYQAYSALQKAAH